MFIKHGKGGNAFIAFIMKMILFAGIMSMLAPEVHAIAPEYSAYKVTLTDPLYEDWTDEYSQFGGTVLYDLDQIKGPIKDICGPIKEFAWGRAYDQHDGWDRNIPNDALGQYTVFAVAPGIVEMALDNCEKGNKSCNGYTGNMVKIRHNEKVVSKYFHLKKNSVIVKKDQWVDRFHPLAYGGSTGQSTGEHLHLQIEVDGSPVDPLSLANDWMPALTFHMNKCTLDPQHNLVDYTSLRDYTKTLTAPFHDNYLAQGYTIKKNTGWLLNTGGSAANELLIALYEKDGKTSALIYDLTGHAPTPITLESAIYNWWQNGGNVNVIGKPIASTFTLSTMTTEILFEKRILVFKGTGGGTITKDQPYPEGACPGAYPSGWMGGKSYAVVTAYKKNGGIGKVGSATGKDAQTPYMHQWNTTGYYLQDFNGGEYGSCGIVLQNTSDNFQAYLIRGKMWDVYRAAGNGPTKFGHPKGDQYLDPKFGVVRQDFEKDLTILATGEVVSSSITCPQVDAGSTGTTCKCPGNLKTLPCGNCGNQQWICQNNLWVVKGSCNGQGACASGKSEEAACGGCGGKTTRICLGTCQWGPWSTCDKAPLTEICDNKDNDCDGQTDEDNICCPQKVEICNGKDDNCNGQVDEGVKNACGGCTILSGQPGGTCGNCSTFQCDTSKEKLNCVMAGACQTGKVKTEPCGTCGGTRTATCINCQWSEWGMCSKLPSWEICDNQDNDCDGQTDEDSICCKLQEKPEICNGKDDDCDGKTDEGLLNACGGCTILNSQPGAGCASCGTYQCDITKEKLNCVMAGACQTGKVKTEPCGTCGGIRTAICNGTCQWSPWSACDKTPLPEKCDSVDNDCDGKTDEDNVCCKPSAEICDNKDNDCDGKTDEDNICCTQKTETCNGKDDNCNGQIDEGVKNECGGCTFLSTKVGSECGTCATYQCDITKEKLNCIAKGECTTGNVKTEPCGTCGGTRTATCIACQWSQWSTCDKTPLPEKCDSVDNDCDGQTDEENICCSPSSEICDNKDNDCNGQIDEGNVCCTQQQEVCNYQDDNCNGQVDEGVKNPCGGCSSLSNQPGSGCSYGGTYQCSGLDSVACNGQPPPPPTKNECGGETTLQNKPGSPCGSCGTYQCSGANSTSCTGQGACTPGTTSQQSCTAYGACGGGSGIQTYTCTSQCQWQVGSCIASGGGGQQYKFDTSKVCGLKYCFRIDSISGNTGYGKISKPNGQPFGNGKMEWFIMNATTGQVMGHSPGFGCDATFTGQYEGNLTFSLNTVQGTSAVYLQTYSNTNCWEEDNTSTVNIQKCY